jgi:hypothetical protein
MFSKVILLLGRAGCMLDNGSMGIKYISLLRLSISKDRRGLEGNCNYHPWITIYVWDHDWRIDDEPRREKECSRHKS